MPRKVTGGARLLPGEHGDQMPDLGVDVPVVRDGRGNFDAEQFAQAPALLAAKVTGAVNLAVVIGPDGPGDQGTAMWEPPMLLNAAEVGVREWCFRPIASTTGQSVTARRSSPSAGPAVARSGCGSGNAAIACKVALDDGRFDEAVSLCAKLHASTRIATAYVD